MPPAIPSKATHDQWLGLVQPVGLVVAPAVLSKLELFPNQGTAYLAARQRQLEALLEERDTAAGEPIQVVPGFPLLATELLDWGEADLQSADQLQAIPEVVLAEYGETLRPTHGVPKLEGEGLQALVLDLTALGEWGRDFDKPWNPTGHGWDATPQQRLERLLKESEHPIGILFNGAALRLVHAPRGESSGWLTLPLEPMAEVAGRPMLGALELLLGFDATERLAQQSGRTVLGALPTTEEGQKHLYGGLITVLQAYGWSDVPAACGFGLDYLDTEDDAQLPDELQERIDSGELFFWDAGDALDFQGQLEAYGAISGRRKLPWRYRWPDAVRDDVLARPWR
jgi:hypothetical protein